jgi:hypothetical protein
LNAFLKLRGAQNSNGTFNSFFGYSAGYSNNTGTNNCFLDTSLASAPQADSNILSLVALLAFRTPPAIAMSRLAGTLYIATHRDPTMLPLVILLYSAKPYIRLISESEGMPGTQTLPAI